MRAMLICPDANLRSDFEATVGHHPAIRLVKSLDAYPDNDTLTRFLRMWGPDVLFMNIEDKGAAERVAKHMDGEFGGIQRIGLSKVEAANTFRLALQLRMAELLVPPFTEEQFEQTLKRIQEHLERNPNSGGKPGMVYAFMPAKGGAGASTLAANTTWAYAQNPGANVLLADFDVTSGVTGFMFNTSHEYSILDAAKCNKHLDDPTWQKLVKRVGNIDLLLSGGGAIEDRMTAPQIAPIIEYARRSYSVVGVDLPDSFDDRTMAVMREANYIFLVTTPDLASLRIARLKALMLRKLDWEEKTRLLLNRVNRRMELGNKEIEASVGLPVFATFPCDYADVTRAARKAEASPKLAPSIREFAEKLGERRLPTEKRARFIERFTIASPRYGSV